MFLLQLCWDLYHPIPPSSTEGSLHLLLRPLTQSSHQNLLNPKPQQQEEEDGEEEDENGGLEEVEI